MVSLLNNSPLNINQGNSPGSSLPSISHRDNNPSRKVSLLSISRRNSNLRGSSHHSNNKGVSHRKSSRHNLSQKDNQTMTNSSMAARLTVISHPSNDNLILLKTRRMITSRINL